MADDGRSLSALLEEAVAAVCSAHGGAAAQHAACKAARFAHLAHTRVLSTAQKDELAGALPEAARLLLQIDDGLRARLHSCYACHAEEAQALLAAFLCGARLR